MALCPGLDYASVCSGGGGLDLAIKLACEPARVRLYVEREAFAVACLVDAMRAGRMDEAPIWSDARTIPGRRFRGLLDGVVGGIPCQPHSLAGKRLGRDDERDLWGPFRRAVVQSGAWWVLLENVPGMLSSGGAERVWRDLRRLGFEVEGGLFSASEIGAPHERERLFILAVVDPVRCGHRGRPGLEERGPLERTPVEWTGGVALFPPGPDDLDAWARIARIRGDLVPATNEPRVRRMAHGLGPRLDALRLLGNGVVPLAGAYAFRTLATRLAARGSAGANLLVRLMDGEELAAAPAPPVAHVVEPSDLAFAPFQVRRLADDVVVGLHYSEESAVAFAEARNCEEIY